ncbi:MAG TPA: glycosyltransferase family 2 protein [Gemmatimonadaceae bacterium]|nr:glycosyltransferase family 2 protein [Gemmatimonadaceae bacterium]
MIYICIPAYNESTTIGVLLWRIRRVFQEYSREYEIIVYDDASTDSTLETLAPYADVIPLTIVKGETRQGYGYALEKLCREVSRRTRYARRDAAIVMQADFTDQPENIPELVKRFEGGSDIVAARQQIAEAPAPVRHLRRLATWIHRSEIPKSAGADPFTTFRLYRISVLREVLKSLGDKPLITTSGWAANMELLVRASRFARRIENVELAPRYDLRTRESRVRPLADAFSLYRFSRRAHLLSASAGGVA